jgi:hypothetical protein
VSNLNRYNQNPMLRRRRSLYFPIAVILGSCVPGASAGELNVSQTPESIIVEAKDVPLAQVLAELQRTINLQYRIPPATSIMVNGRYVGPLPRVLASMLRGTDYILRSAPEGSMLTIVARSPETPIRGPRGGTVEREVPQPSPLGGKAPNSGTPSVKTETAPTLSPDLKRPPPPTYPNEGTTYPAGTNFGKGL